MDALHVQYFESQNAKKSRTLQSREQATPCGLKQVLESISTVVPGLNILFVDTIRKYRNENLCVFSPHTTAIGINYVWDL